MPKGKQSKGICAYCNEAIAKVAVTRHLEKCEPRKTVIAQATAKGSAAETLYHLRVYDPQLKEFWLDLEMRGSATLNELDKYLRSIWLECCGHLSQFGDWGQEISMSRKLSTVVKEGDELIHLYDFGTTSETMVKVVSVRVGQPTTKHPIALMMRNERPRVDCMQCAAAAEWLCMECIYEDQKSGFLCDKHVKGHPHKNYGEPMALVNSPRMGMCGYEGPSEPPY